MFTDFSTLMVLVRGISNECYRAQGISYMCKNKHGGWSNLLYTLDLINLVRIYVAPSIIHEHVTFWATIFISVGNRPGECFMFEIQYVFSSLVLQIWFPAKLVFMLMCKKYRCKFSILINAKQEIFLWLKECSISWWEGGEYW